MAPSPEWVIPLAATKESDEPFIGGKASKLAQLAQTDYRVPGGFFITTRAYEHFLEDQDLARLIRMELGRKSFVTMRWEEIWDVALRIRSAFLATPIPQSLAQAITAAVERLTADGHRVAHAHLRYLNPLPANTKDVLQRYKRVIVPEMNSGQLLQRGLLRQ